MQKKPRLNVFIDSPAIKERGRAAGHPRVGTLSRSDVEADTVLFGYGRGVIDEDAVSLTMPVRADQYDAMAGLLPIFDMNLPEGALKERLRLQFAKAIPECDDLDLLGIVGASQIGRLRYGFEADLNESVPTQDLQEILTYKGSADLFAHLLERFARFSGISGMQPKVLIREIEQPPKVTHLGATHIVKAFDQSEYPELAANEYICTQGAQTAGIRTANVHLSENRRLLVVDRFDLADGGYLGVEDFCVLDGRRAHGRYDGSYEGVARRMRDFLSADALGDGLDQFVRQVAYACIIGNGDAHLKNFAVLYSHAHSRISLAPAYDIVSTRPYIPSDSLALTLGESKDFPDRRHLLRFIRTVTGGTEAAAAAVLRQVSLGVQQARKLATEYREQQPQAAVFSDALLRVLSEGLERTKGVPT